MKIGFIGLGKMSTAIIRGLKNTSFEIIAAGRDPQKTAQDAEQLGITAISEHQALIEQADLIILGVKPQVLPSITAKLHFRQPVISMAAGISLNRLAELIDDKLPLIRIMPNINAQILESSTAICGNDKVDAGLMDLAKEITNSFGRTFDIAEKDFDTFTALAGSGPAYIYLFIETLSLAGVKHGLTKNQALDIVSHTMLASVQNLIANNDSPHDLIDKISSPGGTTIAGLLELEKNGLTTSVIAGIDAAIDRAKKL
ncbi:pyrroline-5-carboxylate reductase [Streptococcus dentapri]|uniref:Pyrroline-5-carboxylate reductase n=1 Tax=Streptococcus dentapri TaxID=573564 RepID=A0ABV8CZW9_9STRE